MGGQFEADTGGKWLPWAGFALDKGTRKSGVLLILATNDGVSENKGTTTEDLGRRLANKLFISKAISFLFLR